MRKDLFSTSLFMFFTICFLGSFSQAQFQMQKNALCFLNKDPDLAQFGFWGELGAREGVCQGIAGISKIFYENVEFQPDKPKKTDTLARIQYAFKTYRARPLHKIVITGYSGLNQLCQDYRNAFLQQSIVLNRDIAISDILPIYPEFNAVKDKPIDNVFQQLKMDKTIKRQIDLLQSGSYPMILVYSHVMLVVDIRWSGSHVVYTYYDSNFRHFQTRTIRYTSYFLPELGQRMIWDITLDN